MSLVGSIQSSLFSIQLYSRFRQKHLDEKKAQFLFMSSLFWLKNTTRTSLKNILQNTFMSWKIIRIRSVGKTERYG